MTKEGNNCGRFTEFRKHEKYGSTGKMGLISAKKS